MLGKLKISILNYCLKIKDIFFDLLTEYSLGIIIFILLGATFLGAGVSFNLTQYNGKDPVNIFYFLSFFVFIPLVIFISAIIFSFFYNNEKKAKALKILFPLAGIIFSLAGIIALFIRVEFSDVVFGWSTTSMTGEESFKNIISLLSWPWSFLGEKFVPSEELIQKSQYFRVGSKFLLSQNQEIKDYIETGSWWRFLTLAIFVYSIIPRFLYLIFVGIKSVPKKILPQKEQYLTYSSSPESFFLLNDKEKDLYFSIILLLLGRESDLDLKNEMPKKEWIRKWKKSLPEFKEIGEEKLIEILKENKSPKLSKILGDIGLFSPYHPLDKDENKALGDEESLRRFRGELKWFLKKSSHKEKEIFNYINHFEAFMSKESLARKLKFTGIGVIGVALVALTGGLAAPALALKLGGVGVAALSKGLALLGLGVLKIGVIQGTGGALFLLGGGGLLGNFLDKNSSSFLEDKNFLRVEINKHKALISVYFFDKKNFEKEKVLYLSFIREQILNIPEMKEKEKNKILDEIQAYIDKLESL